MKQFRDLLIGRMNVGIGAVATNRMLPAGQDGTAVRAGKPEQRSEWY
jgi:hypothetical protein